jgi:hypothetical protein
MHIAGRRPQNSMFRLADAKQVSGRHQRVEVVLFCGYVVDCDHNVDDRLGRQSGDRGGSDGFASGLNQRRRIVSLVSDPALRTPPEPEDGPDFFDRVAVVVYGPAPSTEQLWAVNVAFMSFAALTSFAHLTDDELTTILTGSLRRLQRVR